MADEGHTHLAVGGQFWLVGMAGARSHGGAPHQASELPGTAAKRTILQSILKHLR